MFLSISLKAQSKENPALLRTQIASSKENSQKIALLQKLSDFYINKKGEAKKDLDSAVILNKEAINLSLKIKDNLGKGKSMLLDAKIDRERGNKDAALSKIKNSITYFETHKMTEQTGEGYEELSFIYDNDPKNFDAKIKLKEKALALFKNSGSKIKQASVLKDLGELYLLKGDSDKSIDLLKQSLAVYQSVKFKETQAVYNFLSQAEIQKANYEEALKNGLAAEKIALSVNDNSLQMSSICSNVGMVYYYLRQNDDAMRYWEKALIIAKKNKDNGYVRTVANNMSTMLIRQKKFDQAIAMIKEYKAKYPIDDQQFEMREDYILFSTYTITKQFKNAEAYYKKLVGHYGENGEKFDNQTSLLRSFVFYHYQTKNYPAMYREATLFDSLAKKSGNDMLRSENHLILFKADSTQRKYADAITHYQLYKKFSDSVFNGEKSKQIGSLKIQFETEQKDKNIQLLTQKGKLQDIQIENDAFIKYVFIGSILVLILFAALLYNRSRLKNNANKKLELKRKQIDEQNEQLKKLLAEKEWLLKEIHHRVKNNLQIVISLLNTQSAYLDNEDALMAIQNSQHRMHAMSLIHQKLYQSDNLSMIDMSWYMYELINYIRECYSSENKIKFTVNAEKVFLDVAQAVPMGLIINEAVINTTKYAFPDDKKGEVIVSFKNTGNDNYELIISDNGVGLPAGFDMDATESLGMNLMRGLTDQLDGNFSIENNNGLKITITFRKNTEIEAHEK
ncbi:MULTISPECIES: histidine kinase dimerization/phosphoacceptor domain -containing protein [unclassified Chryseobacterium]|uniref:tetratricopeptide repeat-containing sensor histidine kinase n=1 Tax=unclassified Chryseobacterium TaxID=2593645 RepID=UPI00226AEF6D|nr:MULTISPECIES: histidine kinase dimerization/phosphoacceptor domain -containing protein [unclassified Chryseobacterium]